MRSATQTYGSGAPVDPSFTMAGGDPNTSAAAPAQEASTSTAPAPSASSGFTDFFYDDAGQLLGEYNSSSGYSQETIWFAGLPVAVSFGSSEALYYIHADNLGTPRSITRRSDNKEVWRWDSEPFGKTAVAASSTVTYNLRFPGQYYEYQTGYHYNWMRDYEPRTGRYLQADPIGLAGGLARYTYVGGNPMIFTDPTGLWIYQQSTGNLYSEGNNPSAITLVGRGYSGAVGYQNNGALESLRNVGPIPTGNYTIGAQGTYVTSAGTVLRGAMTLTPKSDSWPYGRSGFLIHGDNTGGGRSASEGCVILGPSLRDMIGGSADTTLKVGP